MLERIHKIIAGAGVASRREAEQMILDGRVTVNGAAVSELGAKADSQRDQVEVDAHPIAKSARKVYVLLNKPKGYACTRRDPHAKYTVMDLIRRVPVPVYPVGRLDEDSQGLLILTNDGSFTFRVTHPSHEIEKTYEVVARGTVPDRELRRLREGVRLDDGMTAPAKVKLLRKSPEKCLVQITIHEGRKRQVRRMLKAVGHPAIDLTRTRIGQLGLGDLQPGRWRYLAEEEVKALLELSGKGEPQRDRE